jgi:hypothetical protein
MKTILTSLSLLLVCSTASARELVVTVSQGPGRLIESTGEPGYYAVEGTAPVRFVAGAAAVVTVESGGILWVRPGWEEEDPTVENTSIALARGAVAADIEIVRGRLRMRVGEKKVILGFDGYRLYLRGVEIVANVTDFGCTVRTLRSSPSTVVYIEASSAMDAERLDGRLETVRDSLTFTREGGVVEPEAGEAEQISVALTALSPGGLEEPFLEPFDIEDPADRRVLEASGDADDAEIEIEEIEVEIEADCVEVCVD